MGNENWEVKWWILKEEKESHEKSGVVRSWLVFEGILVGVVGWVRVGDKK